MVTSDTGSAPMPGNADGPGIEDVGGDKGCHSNDALVDLKALGLRSYLLGAGPGPPMLEGPAIGPRCRARQSAADSRGARGHRLLGVAESCWSGRLRTCTSRAGCSGASRPSEALQQDRLAVTLSTSGNRTCNVPAVLARATLTAVHTQVTAVYADILGFAQLVTSYNSLIDSLDGFSHSASSEAELREQLEEWNEDPLTRTFTAFHRTLDFQLNFLVNADPLQSIVFSDSAFVAFSRQ